MSYWNKINFYIIKSLKKQFLNITILKDYTSIFFLITYSYFWISIGKFVKINLYEFSLNGYLFLSIFLTCLIILLIKFIKNKKLPFLSILLIYPISAAIGYLNNINNHGNYELLIHFFFTISSLIIFFSILNIKKSNINLFNYFFKISIIFIFLVFFIMVLPDLIGRIFNNIHVREVYFVTLKLFFFEYTYVQNSNGASRIAILIFLIFFTKLIFKLKKNKDLKKYFFLSFVFSLIVFYFQSRLSILFLIFYVFLWTLNFKNKNFLFKFSLIVSIIIIPFLVQNYYNKKFEPNATNSFDISNNRIILNVKSIKKIKRFHAHGSAEKCKLSSENKFVKYIDIYSSGRLCGWEILLKDIEKKDIFFGKGYFYDQIYLKNLEKISSNSYINIIYNSGLIGFVPFIILFLIFVKSKEKIFKKYKNSKYFDFLIYNLLLYLLIRSFFEDTLAFVSIDSVLFLTCVVNLSSKITNSKKETRNENY